MNDKPLYTLEEVQRDIEIEASILNEFKLSPFQGLEPYLSVYGEMVYSSKKIENIIIDKIKNNTKYNKLNDILISGIKKHRIVIGYTTRNKFSFIMNRIKMTTGIVKSWGMGYFYNEGKTIVILLDHNVSILGNEIFSSLDTIVHELCHLITSLDPKYMFKATKDNILIPYYKTLIYETALAVGVPSEDIKISKAKLEKTIFELIKEEQNTIQTGTSFKKIIESLMKTWGYVINDLEPKNKRDDILHMMVVGYANFYNIKYDEIKEAGKYIDKSIACYQKAYLKNFKSDISLDTYPGQEFCFPSEVISIVSTYENTINPTIIKALQNIKF